MTHYALFTMVIGGAILYAISRYIVQSRRQRALENHLASQNPDFKYDHNRFNTKREQTVQILIRDGQVILETDVHIIQVSNYTLILHIRAKTDQMAKPFSFKLLVQPFDMVIFETDYYQSVGTEGGHLFFFGEGVPSPAIIDFAERQGITSLTGNLDGNFVLSLHEIIPDPAEQRVLFNGSFSCGDAIQIELQREAFTLRIQAPLEALQRPENFQQTAESVLPKTDQD